MSDPLFDANVFALDQMRPTAAGTAVKAVLMCLAGNEPACSIRLKNPDGRRIEYELVQGEHNQVGRCARALGVSIIEDRFLEARSK